MGLKALPEQAKPPPDRREAAVGGVPSRHQEAPYSALVYVRERHEISLPLVMLDRQKVRFRSGSHAPRWLAISPDAVGIVICRYRSSGEAKPCLIDWTCVSGSDCLLGAFPKKSSS